MQLDGDGLVRHVGRADGGGSLRPDGPGQSAQSRLGGSASDGPESVRRESVQESVRSRDALSKRGEARRGPDKRRSRRRSTCYRRVSKPRYPTRHAEQTREGDAVPPLDYSPYLIVRRRAVRRVVLAVLDKSSYDTRVRARTATANATTANGRKGLQPDAMGAAPPPPAETGLRLLPEDTVETMTLSPTKDGSKHELAKPTPT